MESGSGTLMKPKSFEITTLCRGVERYVSDDPKKPSGWWLNLYLGNDTSLRLFFPNDHFKVTRTVGYDEDRHPIEADVTQIPLIALGELIMLHVLIPLADP